MERQHEQTESVNNLVDLSISRPLAEDKFELRLSRYIQFYLMMSVTCVLFERHIGLLKYCKLRFCLLSLLFVCLFIDYTVDYMNQ